MVVSSVSFYVLNLQWEGDVRRQSFSGFATRNQCDVGGYIATIKMEIRQSILKLYRFKVAPTWTSMCTRVGFTHVVVFRF